jgi:anti-anti-sigma factor
VNGRTPIFEIRESHTGDWTRLSLTGELDLRSAPMLEDRLARLRVLKSPVTLDLSKLDFIDSTGIHLLVRTFGEARLKHWQLQIDRDLSPQVMRVFRLARMDDRVVWSVNH